MELEKAKDILLNIIDDEVIGTYCIEIQKQGIPCELNCKTQECYLHIAIETVLKSLEDYKKENENIKKILLYEIEYRQKLEEDLYQSCSNYVVPKDKIKGLIEQLEKEGYWNFLEERDLDITKNILKDLLKEE